MDFRFFTGRVEKFWVASQMQYAILDALGERHEMANQSVAGGLSNILVGLNTF